MSPLRSATGTLHLNFKGREPSYKETRPELSFQNVFRKGMTQGGGKMDKIKSSSKVPHFNIILQLTVKKGLSNNLVTYIELELQLISYGSPCSGVSLQNLSHQTIKKAKELHQSTDQPLVQLERCQTRSGTKKVGFHTKGYKQLHRYSTCLLLSHMTYVELQEPRSMHFLQYHSTSHLQKLKY